jgi:hypothetical protein
MGHPTFVADTGSPIISSPSSPRRFACRDGRGEGDGFMRIRQIGWAEGNRSPLCVAEERFKAVVHVLLDVAVK